MSHDRFDCKVENTIISDCNAISFNFKSYVNNENSCKCFSTSKIRLVDDISANLFIKCLNTTNWIEVYSQDNIENKFKYFMQVYLRAINGNFPLVRAKLKNSKSDNNWYTVEFAELKQQCDKFIQPS